MTEAWTFDAVNYSGDPTSLMVRMDEVDKFNEEYTKKLAIVAPKGMGKTFILRNKSTLLRERYSTKGGAVFIPATRPLEEFNQMAHDFSEGAHQQFNSIATWKTLWATSIGTVILYRTIKEVAPPAFSTFASSLGLNLSARPEQRPAITIESIVKKLLGRKFGVYEDIFTTVISPALTEINDRIFVFIDSVDQAWEHEGKKGSVMTGPDNFFNKATPSRRKGEVESEPYEEAELDISDEIWFRSQLGMLAAQRDIKAANHKIKVFSAIRKEAHDWGESALGLQTDELLLNLKYSKEHIKLMFEANIGATQRSSLVKPSARDPIERFLGFTTISHICLRPPTEFVSTESVFDFIYRHTFGRPRECIYVGTEIFNTPPSERTPDKVKDIVNKCALAFFTQYKNEIRPKWDNRYDKLLTKIGCNILSERAVFTIFDKLRRSNGDLVDPFSYYVSRGLIGYSRAVADGGNAERIEFRAAGEYHFKAIELNHSSHYFLHPCVTALMRNTDRRFVTDERQLVGDGLRARLGREADIFHVSLLGRRRFRFTYNSQDVSSMNKMHGVGPSLLAAVLCTIQCNGVANVSAADVAEKIKQMAQADAMSDNGGAWRDLQSLFERCFTDGKIVLSNTDLTLINMIDQALSECAQLASNPADSPSGDSPNFEFDNDQFSLRLCGPGKIDAMSILELVEDTLNRD